VELEGGRVLPRQRGTEVSMSRHRSIPLGANQSWIILVPLLVVLAAQATKAAPIIHIHDDGGRLATVDVATGTATVIGTMGAVMTDIAFDADGNLLGLDFANLYQIDPNTAVITLIGSHGIGSGNSLVFGLDGTLFAAGALSTSLFTVNPSTGAATSIGDIGFASAGDLAFNGGQFFMASTADELVRIDLSFPVISATSVGPFGFSNVFGLATGNDGVLYGVAGTQIFSVDTSTGAGTLASNFDGQGLSQAWGSSFTTEAIPEPSTFTLLSLGTAALACVRRIDRRRHR
jgi:hypothetical protein